MMDKIKTAGLTIFRIKGRHDSYTCSVLSRRGAALALKKSHVGKWNFPILTYIRPISVDRFLLVGFQPDTGRHIAIIDNQRVDWTANAASYPNRCNGRQK